MINIDAKFVKTLDVESIELLDPKINKFSNTDTKNDLTFTWKNISLNRTRILSSGFFKRTRHEEIQILNDVSGEIQSGKLMAVMGPSGSGKTTLLAAISMRVQGDITGSLFLNGRSITKEYLASISGFVPQNDLAFESLTAYEHMEFMAKMKMDRHMKSESRKKRIEELLQQLGIAKCSQTRLSGLSGGERKRLSLAVQMINDPPLLFCDEPTTGLDSWSAASVVMQLRKLAMAGKAVICSIHQPASGIFDLFNDVLILTGGKIAYQGPVKRASIFFSSQGFPTPIGFNEAEFLVSIISNEERAHSICAAWSKQEAIEQFNQTTDKTKNSITTKNKSSEFKANENLILNNHFSVQKPGNISQFYWLLWRSFISARRDSRILIAEFTALMAIAFVLALPFMNIFKDVEQRDIQNVQGLLYLTICEMVFMSIYSVFMTFPAEIGILLRELANGLYTPGPYYLSKVLFLIPRAVIESFLYSAIIFWLVGLRGGFTGFILFVFPVMFAAHSANAYGAWLSATFESMATATLVSVPVDLVSCIFAGNFLSLGGLPLYLAWLKYLSMFFYPTEAISILQWKMVDKIECANEQGLPCIETGAGVLDVLGYQSENYNLDLFRLFIMYSLYHFFGFIALLRRSKRQPIY